jgi:hypothetical protein
VSESSHGDRALCMSSHVRVGVGPHQSRGQPALAAGARAVMGMRRIFRRESGRESFGRCGRFGRGHTELAHHRASRPGRPVRRALEEAARARRPHPIGPANARARARKISLRRKKTQPQKTQKAMMLRTMARARAARTRERLGGHGSDDSESLRCPAIGRAPAAGAGHPAAAAASVKPFQAGPALQVRGCVRRHGNIKRGRPRIHFRA